MKTKTELKVKLMTEQKDKVISQAKRNKMNMSEYVISLVEREEQKIKGERVKRAVQADMKRLRELRAEAKNCLDAEDIEDYKEEIEEYREIATVYWDKLAILVPRELDKCSARRISEASSVYDEKVFYLNNWKKVEKRQVVDLLSYNEDIDANFRLVYTPILVNTVFSTPYEGYEDVVFRDVELLNNELESLFEGVGRDLLKRLAYYTKGGQGRPLIVEKYISWVVERDRYRVRGELVSKSLTDTLTTEERELLELIK